MTIDQKMIHQTYPATKNKWYADIPLTLISNDFKDVTLHLQDFTIPRIEVAAADLSFRGVTIEVPSRTFNPGSKRVNFSYLIDSKWESYLALYQWANCYTSIDNPTPNDKVREKDKTAGWWAIPIHVYLLNEFRQTIMNVVYYGCVIKEFSEFNVAYTSEPEPMSHSFTVSYQRVAIGHQNPLEYSKNQGT